MNAGRGHIDRTSSVSVERVRRNDHAGAVPPRFLFELFEGTHRGIDHRYPAAPPYLAERLSAP